MCIRDSVQVCDLRGTDDAAVGVNGGRSGLCLNAVNDEVGIETVYGAVDLSLIHI